MPRSIHLLCGAGGDATGLWEAGFDPILGINHWQTSVDTFGLNHPTAEARCADIQNYPMRWLPRALVLWASVICTEISPAGGRKRPDPVQDALFEEEEQWRELPPEAFEMTRVTAWCVLRAAEAKRFPAVVVENVLEFVTDWLLFPVWIDGMKKLGYRVQIVSVSSAHIGSETNPHAPQWRDRVYLVFTLTGVRRPDLAPRPLAHCFACGRDVKARQSWRDPQVKVGKYGVQYDYRCPNTRCGRALVEPYVRPASDVIMWDDIGQRIGDRAKPLVPNTMKRIAAGLEKFPYDPSVVTLTHGKDGTARAFDPHTRPLPTRTSKLGEALLVPVGGSWNDTASSAAEPMRTRTTRESEALVTVDPFIVEFRNNCDAASIDAPLSTIATARHHGLVVPDGDVRTRARNTLVIPYRKAAPKTAGEPLHTLATRDSAAVVRSAPAIEDCYFRMLQPREQLSAQRFPGTYEVVGSKAAQTKQAGNAVSVNVARWIGERLKAVLA
ncbi:MULTISPECIES: DNA cytosine methyltransferase [Streptomyces]|uniref:DNA cytosine methyltransferase n=1 Tax=Streptomyces TaxID=1883 RepID=UPI00081B9DCC|nr:DNA cytosine methyltransferase [Streptomyces sp. DvalAA-43]MYQ85496.1 DNA cytosine methyltransferase [Streptomyces sp. SID4936]SCE05842.1 DNA (cytosine-5)-methyltransferase 1 [Streptomyces sp. DvalAA-43]